MPVNYTPEYLAAERRYHQARGIDERIIALEEMIRLLPKHKSSENVQSQLRARLAKFKKEVIAAKKRGKKEAGIKKEGEAQVCLLGKPMSGKSWLLQELTEARPRLADHPYTTTKPEIGMMDWRGVNIQLIEIPATFDPSCMSICRTADAIVLVVKNDDDKEDILELLRNHYIRRPYIFINPWIEDPESIRQRIGSALGLIISYTKTSRGLSPMALPAGSTVRVFAERIHKDFIKHFHFAFLWRTIGGTSRSRASAVQAKSETSPCKKRKSQVGLDYVLQDGDVVELHMK